ncbi:hypothetical protein 2 [Hubei odonate virus 7]|uniref:hypothetical protein 2 n=1 Tax=Hubei odonate virus 7 TaxID=1923002 RepID=UPI00090A0F28|nr:hypothetical protein 2 [Hubei odonate virus 7]APG78005.1 hypothetical protein 2 [Hubei odonate virus 7]
MRRIKTYFNLPNDIQDESDAHQLLSSQQDPIVEYIRENNSTSYKAIEAYADPEKLVSSINDIKGRVDQIQRTVDSVGTTAGNNAIQIQNLGGVINTEIEDRKSGDREILETLDRLSNEFEGLSNLLNTEIQERKKGEMELSDKVKSIDLLVNSNVSSIQTLNQTIDIINSKLSNLLSPINLPVNDGKIGISLSNGEPHEYTRVSDSALNQNPYLAFDTDYTFRPTSPNLETIKLNVKSTPVFNKSYYSNTENQTSFITFKEIN